MQSLDVFDVSLDRMLINSPAASDLNSHDDHVIIMSQQ